MSEKRIEVERKCDDTYSIAGYAETYSAREVLDDCPDHFTIIYDDDPQGKQDEPREARLQRLWDELDAKDALKSIADHEERIAALEKGRAYASTVMKQVLRIDALEGWRKFHDPYNTGVMLLSHTEPPAPAEPTLDLDALEIRLTREINDIDFPEDCTRKERYIANNALDDVITRVRRIFAAAKEASRES